MRKEFIVPALFVSGWWIVVSPVATYLMVWLDRTYQTTLKHDLDAIHAAGVVREDVWRVVSYADAGDLWPNLPPMQHEIEVAVGDLHRLMIARAEAWLVGRLQSEWRAMLARIALGDGAATLSDLRELRLVAESISATANEIRIANRTHLIATERHLEWWKGFVRAVRFLLISLGAALGVALWWWISRRFHRSIAQINVILKDATLEWELSLAQLRRSSREDLGELHERVERMVARMRAISSELDVSRQEAILSERLAAVGELAAGVVHELRNPLTSVKLLLQHATGKPGETKLGELEGRIVLDEISRMEHTIQGLLDFSRPPAGQPRPHDLRDTLQRALHLVRGRATQQGVRLSVASPDRPVMINGDHEQLHQVCVNLLINGIESMVSGGTLEVAIDADPTSRSVRIHFRDHGPGIPADILAHMFEPFVSTKRRGTGLGLAISRRIVVQHGGSLVVENHSDGGALVILELPSHHDCQANDMTPPSDRAAAAIPSRDIGGAGLHV